MPSLEHFFALFRRQLLELLVSLHHALALLWGQAAVARVLLLQLLTSLRRQLAPFSQPLEHSLAFVGRQAAKLLEVLLHPFPLLGSHRLPSPKVLEHLRALIGRKLRPFIRTLRGERPFSSVGRLRHGGRRRWRRLRIGGRRNLTSADQAQCEHQGTREMLAPGHGNGPSTSSVGALCGNRGSVRDCCDRGAASCASGGAGAGSGAVSGSAADPPAGLGAGASLAEAAAGC